MKDHWVPEQLWGDIVLPCDKPNVTYITFSSMTDTQSASNGLATTTGCTAASSSNLNKDKLNELVSLHKQTAKILKELGAVPAGVQLQESDTQKIPIATDSRKCPVCNKTLGTHYRAVLHYKYQHLHRTKWFCKVCSRFFTSQANLDEHEYIKHAECNYVCSFCDSSFEHEKQILCHLRKHTRYEKAVKAGVICKFCHQKRLDMAGHVKTCVHNPNRSTEKFTCTNAGCTSQFSRKKDRNYHSKTRCNYGKK